MKYTRAISIVIVSLILIFQNVPDAAALTVSNNNYILQIESVDSNPPVQQSPLIQEQKKEVHSAKLPFTILTNYGLEKNARLQATLSQEILDFGSLSPTNPVKRSHNISIKSGGDAYAVFVFQDHTLTSASTQINGTSCDQGVCSTNRASIWESPLTYGFGYRCDTILPSFACTNMFTNKNSYAKLTDLDYSAQDQKPTKGYLAAEDAIFNFTYKVNIPATQPYDTYTNTITYLVVPEY